MPKELFCLTVILIQVVFHLFNIFLNCEPFFNSQQVFIEHQYLLGTVLGFGDTIVSKTKTFPCAA